MTPMTPTIGRRRTSDRSGDTATGDNAPLNVERSIWMGIDLDAPNDIRTIVRSFDIPTLTRRWTLVRSIQKWSREQSRYILAIFGTEMDSMTPTYAAT